MPASRWTACIAIAALGALGALAACGAPAAAPPAPEPEAARYVEPSLCLGCHPDQAARWRGSHHARAMAEPSPASVAGEFSGAIVDGARLVRDGDHYAIDVAGAAGRPTRLRVRYTFGTAPLQQYLVEQPGGRLQAFGLAWDTERRAWFSVQSAELPWTSRYQTWNTMCAACHSTAVDKRYDPAADRFATTFADVAVGCQACHGPGSQHAVNPARRLTVDAGVEACAPCHARRTAITAIAAPGAPLFDQFRPATLQAGLYYPDGQIRDEVFEYGSFAQSAMHERGVRCVDCHDPHAARAEPADATCLRCHGATPPPPQFPGLAARARDVASPAHHHHAPGGPGSHCVDCHMPERTYLKIDGRRDHAFRIPRPDVSAQLGSPDACTAQCHAGRDARWAAGIVAAWFPHARPAMVGEVFARAQRGEPVGAELAQVALDLTRPAIVRASALELGAGDPAACAAAARALGDPSPLVRSVAVACAEHLAPVERARFAAAALADPIRLVRIEAARVLAGDASAALSPADRASYARARSELDAADRLDLDRPEGWYNLALLAEAEHRRAEAVSDLRRALGLDPGYKPARAGLAALAP